MKPGQASITAQGAAFLRARETRKPADQRVCSDPLAHLFVNPLLWTFITLFSPLNERSMPGTVEYLIARTRYFDDAINASLQQGVQQLVILGAGYDSRAYRLEGREKYARIFEVDHPATQAAKRKRLQRIGITVPENVCYIPIDFMTERLDKLFDYGYRTDCLTLFIWEGVVPYLSTEAVSQTLAFVRQQADPGSTIIFDYIYTEALTSPHPRPEIVRLRRLRRFTGEDISFGIPEGTSETFLKEQGFTRVAHATHRDLERLYFQGKTPARQVAPIYAIVSARSQKM